MYFHEFQPRKILEYLTPEQQRKFNKYKISAAMRKVTDPFFGVGVDMKREDLSDPDGALTDKSEVHKAIERALGQTISTEDYRRGLIKDRYGREVKIGRQLKDENLRNQYASDNTKAGAKKSGYYVTVHRGEQVAGQTNSKTDANHPKGHNWEAQSCKNIDTGSNRSYLPGEIKAGTVVVFVHDHTGQEIYRATLHPYVNDRQNIIYYLDAEYGVRNPTFNAQSKDIASRLSTKLQPGAGLWFRIIPGAYNNSGTTEILHPDATPEQILDAYHKMEQKEREGIDIPYSQIEAICGYLTSKNCSNELVTAVLGTGIYIHSDLVTCALRSIAISDKQIDDIFHMYPVGVHNSQLFRTALAKNPKVKPEQLRAIITDSSESDHNVGRTTDRSEHWSTIQAAIANPSLPDDMVDYVIKYLPNYVRGLTNRRLTSEQLSMILGNVAQARESLGLVSHFANHRDIGPEHLHYLLTSDSPNAVKRAIESPHMTAEMLSKYVPEASWFNSSATYSPQWGTVLDSPKLPESLVDLAIKTANYSVRALIAAHEKTLPRQLDVLAKDDDDAVVFDVMKNRNATPENLHIGLKHKNTQIRLAVVANPNMTPELLQIAIYDQYWRVRFNAIMHPNATVELVREALKIPKPPRGELPYNTMWPKIRAKMRMRLKKLLAGEANSDGLTKLPPTWGSGVIG